MEVIALSISIVIVAFLWNIRSGIFAITDTWKDKVFVATSEDKIEIQEDIKDLHDKVLEIRKTNGNKWFTVSDIDELMK